MEGRRTPLESLLDLRFFIGPDSLRHFRCYIIRIWAYCLSLACWITANLCYMGRSRGMEMCIQCEPKILGVHCQSTYRNQCYRDFRCGYGVWRVHDCASCV